MESTTVHFQSTWYIWANLSVLIFSFTLVIHMSNSFTSCRLLAKMPRDLLLWLGAIHATSAIMCHISRITDYFFTTNCNFKYIFNPSFYYVSTTILAAVLYRRCYLSLRHGQHLFFLGSIIIFGLKLSGLMVLLSNYAPAPAVFHECKTSVAHNSAAIFYGIEICMNAYLILWWLIILALRISLQNRSWPEAIQKDDGAYTLASAISTVIFMSLLMHGIVFGLSADIPFQIQWAIQSMLCTQQLVNYYDSMQHTLPTVTKAGSTTACEPLRNRDSFEDYKGDAVIGEFGQQSTCKSYQVLSRDMDISL